MCRYSECFGCFDKELIELYKTVFEKHREHVWGTRVPFSAFFGTVETKISPVVDYSIKLSKFISSSNFSRKSKCAGV